VSYIKVWNNQECKLTKGKSGHYFDDILYFINAGDLLIDANGKEFKCSLTQHQDDKPNLNWFVCVNELTKKKRINQRKKSVVYARLTLTNEWTKSFKSLKDDIYSYPWAVKEELL
tara:strand:- start:1121 stop:1465 length:345 start_codon:yes stop_codon:yes gene_type:complete